MLSTGMIICLGVYRRQSPWDDSYLICHVPGGVSYMIIVVPDKVHVH